MAFLSSDDRNISYPPRPQGRHQSAIITLLTDFGLEDVYVGVMKGVIARIHPQAIVVDLTHQISPQNIALGSFHLGNAYGNFPPSTIHVAVVDPGVGSSRRAVAFQTHVGTFVGPDNGVFSHVLRQHVAIAAVELTNPDYWNTPNPSHTFHGRDIFAPAAAHLATAIPLLALGSALQPSSLKTIAFTKSWQPTRDGGIGAIQAIDHFGNLITNIPASQIQHDAWSLKIDQHHIPSAKSYTTQTTQSALIALIGSHGWLEIALASGSAQHFLNAHLGKSVHLQFRPPLQQSNLDNIDLQSLK